MAAVAAAQLGGFWHLGGHGRRRRRRRLSSLPLVTTSITVCPRENRLPVAVFPLESRCSPCIRVAGSTDFLHLIVVIDQGRVRLVLLVVRLSAFTTLKIQQYK